VLAARAPANPSVAAVLALLAAYPLSRQSVMSALAGFDVEAVVGGASPCVNVGVAGGCRDDGA
jgi:hypothetical protein